MSRLRELIDSLCPDGVQHVPLADLLEYEQPTKYLVQSANYDDAYATPVLTAGQTFVLGYTDETSGIYEASSTRPVIIFDDFTTAFKWVDFPFKAKSSAMKMLTPKPEDRVRLRFAYYAMQLITYRPQDHARQWISRYSGFEIPVPPIAVQEEIVRILDLFRALESELDAELRARRRQYAQYRDTILTFPAGITRIPMGELGMIFGGLTGKSKADFSGGDQRFVSYVNIFNNIAVNVRAGDFVRIAPGEHQRALQRGDILFTGSSETPEEVGMSSVVAAEITEPLYLNSFSIGFRPNDPAILDPDFSKHLFRSGEMRRQLVRTASGVTRFNVSKARLAKVVVPLPGLDEQRRIASALDKFEALVNSHSDGLPAELNLRSKQFRHYRDRLLTFEAVA